MNPAPVPSAPDPMSARRRVVSKRGMFFGFIFGFFYPMARNVARSDSVPDAVKVALCFAFATAFACFFWRTERDLMASSDELQQRIRLEAMASALPITLAIVMLLGALDQMGIPLLPPMYYWLPAASVYLVTLIVAKRRYS